MLLKSYSLLVIYILLLFVTCPFAKAQEVITLQKAIENTMNRNLSVKESEMSETTARLDVQQAKFNKLPTLTSGLQAEYNLGRSPDLATYSYTSQSFVYSSSTLSLSMTIFQGEQIHNQILQTKLALDADKASTNKVKNDLILNVITTYLTILTNQDLVEAAQRQIDIADKTLERTQKKVNACTQTSADLSQAQADLANANFNSVSAKGGLQTSILALKQLMNVPPSANIICQKPDMSKFAGLPAISDSSSLIKDALNVSPDVKLAQLQQQVAEQSIKVAKGAYYPTVSLFAGLGTAYSNQTTEKVIGSSSIQEIIGTVKTTGDPVLAQQSVYQYAPYTIFNQFTDNFNQSFGLSIQIPIFNKYTARTSVRKAKITYESAVLNTEITKNAVTNIIVQASQDAIIADQKYNSALQSYNSYTDAFKAAQIRYKVGLINSLEYTIALTNYEQAETNVIEAKFNLIFKTLIIDYYLGKPIKLD